MHALLENILRCLYGVSFFPVVLLCVATGCGHEGKGNPSYRGRALSEWIDQLGNPKLQGASRQEAVLAVQSIGTNALPLLIAQIKLGSAIDGQRRMGIVAAFEILGRSGEVALPDLTDIAGHSDERAADTALWALSRMGNPGVQAMTNALANSNDPRRLKIVQMLHSMGTNAYAAVPSLLSCLRNIQNDYDTAFWAGCGAARAGRQPSEIVQTLTTNLLVGSSACRYGSASGLRLFGAKAAQAIPTLETLLSDTNERVRYAASNALSSIKQ